MKSEVAKEKPYDPAFVANIQESRQQTKRRQNRKVGSGRYMGRIIEYTLKAHEDIVLFKKSVKTNILKKIHQLMESIQQNPFEGIGKPEPLKHQLSGCWSLSYR